MIILAFIFVFAIWRLIPEQFPDFCDICGAVAISEEAIVADAMLAFGQDMHQEPADELVDLQGHGCVSARADGRQVQGKTRIRSIAVWVKPNREAQRHQPNERSIGV